MTRGEIWYDDVMTMTLGHVCRAVGVVCPDTARDIVITAVKPLQDAGGADLSFLDNPAYKAHVGGTKAAAVFIRPEEVALLPAGCVALVTSQPYVAFAMSLALLYPSAPVIAGVSPLASIDPTAVVDPTACIEPFAVVKARAVVGAGSCIGAHTLLGEGVTIGARSRIGAHCVLLKTLLGDDCVLHAGVRVGQDGFGFAVHEEKVVKIPQVGGVRIGNDVEIGANTTIDCGALGDTVIEDNVKIDNQVQIAHNVRIGAGSRIVAQVGVAGSSTLGSMTVIGGQSGIAGHVHVGSGVQVAGASCVTKNIPEGAVVAGFPASPIADWRAGVAVVARMARAVRRKKETPQGGV